jgi:methionyl-tRNA formyltransferase
VLRTIIFTDVHSAFGIPHFYELLRNGDCEVVSLVVGPAAGEATGADMEIIDKWGVTREENPIRAAEARGIPILRPEKVIMPAFTTALRELQPHVLVSAGFRRILPREVLEIPAIAAVNFHPSLLPKMRGCDPWFWTIREGETESAATVHFMDERLDAGDIIFQTVIPLTPTERAGTLFQKTLVESLRLVAPLFQALRSGSVPRTPQDQSKASTYPPPRPEDYRIDWNSSAVQIFNLIRASKCRPGARATFKSREVIIAEAEVGSDPALLELPAKPGSVIKVSAQALVVRAGDGNVVVRLLDYEGQRWNAAKFVSFFRCGTCPDIFV